MESNRLKPTGTEFTKNVTHNSSIKRALENVPYRRIISHSLEAIGFSLLIWGGGQSIYNVGYDGLYPGVRPIQEQRDESNQAAGLLSAGIGLLALGILSENNNR